MSAFSEGVRVGAVCGSDDLADCEGPERILVERCSCPPIERLTSTPPWSFRSLGGSVCLLGVRQRLRLVVSRGGVVVDARLRCGVDVDGGVVEAGNAVDQLVMGLIGDRMGLDHA
jgi:hypothetical protein